MAAADAIPSAPSPDGVSSTAVRRLRLRRERARRTRDLVADDGHATAVRLQHSAPTGIAVVLPTDVRRCRGAGCHVLETMVGRRPRSHCVAAHRGTVHDPAWRQRRLVGSHLPDACGDRSRARVRLPACCVDPGDCPSHPLVTPFVAHRSAPFGVPRGLACRVRIGQRDCVGEAFAVRLMRGLRDSSAVASDG
jgi:hypothetical protein